MAEQETVTVSLPQARVFRGKAYGPGRAVEVPVRVAKALGLEKAEEPKAKGKPK